MEFGAFGVKDEILRFVAEALLSPDPDSPKAFDPKVNTKRRIFHLVLVTS